VKLKAKLLDIDNKGVLINRSDARMVGVSDGDRVTVINPRTSVSVQVHVDTTQTLVDPGLVGVYLPPQERIGVNEGEDLEVREAFRPESLEFIRKKMDGKALKIEEYQAIMKDIVDDNLAKGEVSAFVIASYINGMNMDEIESLTRAMVDVGDKMEFSTGPIVDKHSIGGVPGNKISLLVVPIIAAAGLMIPKTSSRAITGAGGTADLMEVLAPVDFTVEEIQLMTEKVGGVIVWGGSTNIAPADDKIIVHEYPFKIDARGQMLASVMAKKFAIGAEVVVIDIPVGENTKVPNIEDGKKLARQFMELGERLGMEVECALTYGSLPVGHSIGPKLEVKEALGVLEGADTPRSLIHKSISIAGIALEMAGKVPRGEGNAYAEELLCSGKALAKMKEIIEIQGGDPNVTSGDIVPGKFSSVVHSPDRGFVVHMNNASLISMARLAGAPGDPGAGIYIHAKGGTMVEKGDPLMTVYAEREWRLEKALTMGRRLFPILVEGMLIDRVSSARVIGAKKQK